jgi:hypothetical protein
LIGSIPKQLIDEQAFLLYRRKELFYGKPLLLLQEREQLRSYLLPQPLQEPSDRVKQANDNCMILLGGSQGIVGTDTVGTKLGVGPGLGTLGSRLRTLRPGRGTLDMGCARL